MRFESKTYIAGHKGLVGSALYRKLTEEGHQNLITRSRPELDLVNQKSVESFFREEKPEYVLLAAARVGGILANSTYPAEFIYDNLTIQTNVIHQAFKYNVKKLLFLGSSCIYPVNAPQPMKEEYLMSGELEATNEPYAIAKIAGVKMCQAYNRQYGTKFISVMPTNLYGPGDNFDLHQSHVLPALIRKVHEAQINDKPFIEVWGSGTPHREFLHVADLADACLFLMQNYDDSEIINIGVGKDISIQELAEMIKEIVGYTGEIKLDRSKPDGAPRKLLDVSKMDSLGWKPKYSLREGIRHTYEWFREEYRAGRV